MSGEIRSPCPCGAALPAAPAGGGLVCCRNCGRSLLLPEGGGPPKIMPASDRSGPVPSGAAPAPPEPPSRGGWVVAVLWLAVVVAFAAVLLRLVLLRNTPLSPQPPAVTQPPTVPAPEKPAVPAPEKPAVAVAAPDPAPLADLTPSPAAWEAVGERLAVQPSALDGLDPRNIAAALRSPGQPKELVAVIGAQEGAYHQNLCCLALSPDGRRVATGGWDSRVRLWDAQSLRLLTAVEAGGSVRALAFSPDGKALAVAAAGVHLWDVSGDRPRGRWAIPAGSVRSVAFSPDGRLLALGDVSHDRPAPGQPEQSRHTIRLWDLGGAPPTPVGVLVGSAEVEDLPLAFAPDGRTLASASGGVGREEKRDARVLLWGLPDLRAPAGQMRRLEPREVLPGHRLDVRAVAFAPDGKALASGSLDGTVRLWGLTTAPARLRDTLADKGRVHGLAYAAGGKTLAVLSDLRAVPPADAEPSGLWPVSGWRVQLWELAGKAPAARAAVNLDDAAPAERPYFLPFAATHGLVALTPDGRALVAAPPGGPLRRYDLSGQGPVERPAAADADFVRWAALLPDGERLVTLGRDGGVRLWDLGGDRPALLSRTPSPKQAGWFRPHLTPDGRTLVLSVGGANEPYPLWVLRLGDGPPTECALLEGPRATGSGGFAALGSLVAVRADDSKVVWDVSGTRPRERPDLAGVGDRLLQEEMAVAPDGRTTALCEGGGPVWITEQHGKAPRPRYALPEALGLLPPWAFAPDGTRLALSVHPPFMVLGRPNPLLHFTNTLTLWDLKGEQPRKYASLEHRGEGAGGLGVVAGVAFAPDGRLVLSTGPDRVLIWDAADGRKLREWQVPGGVDSAAFAPDGRHLVALTLTGAVYVLRLFPGRESPDPKVAARARVLRARRALRQNRIPETLAALAEAVRLDPACVEAHYTLGLAHLRAQDPDKALADLSKVIELDERHAQAHYRRGLLYADRKDFVRARADLDRAAALDPSLAQRRP